MKAIIMCSVAFVGIGCTAMNAEAQPRHYYGYGEFGYYGPRHSVRIYRRPRFEFYYSPGYHNRGPVHYRSYHHGYVPHRRGQAYYDYGRPWGGPFYHDRDDWDDFEDRLEDRREDYEDWVEDRREEYEDRMEELRERREERWEDWRDRFDD